MLFFFVPSGLGARDVTGGLSIVCPPPIDTGLRMIIKFGEHGFHHEEHEGHEEHEVGGNGSVYACCAESDPQMMPMGTDEKEFHAKAIIRGGAGVKAPG